MKVANNSPPHTRSARPIPSSLKQSLAANMKNRMASIVRNMFTPFKNLTTLNREPETSSNVTEAATKTEKNETNQVVKISSQSKSLKQVVAKPDTSSNNIEKKYKCPPSKIPMRSSPRTKMNGIETVKNNVKTSPNGPKVIESPRKSTVKVAVNLPKNKTLKNQASSSSISKVIKKSPSKFVMEFSPMKMEDNPMILNIKPIEMLTEILKPEKPSPVELLIEKNKHLRVLSQAGSSQETSQLPTDAQNINQGLIELNNIPPLECPDLDCNLCEMPEQSSQTVSTQNEEKSEQFSKTTPKKVSPKIKEKTEQISKKVLPQKKEKRKTVIKSEPISPSKNTSPLKKNSPSKKTEAKKSLVEQLKSVRLDKVKPVCLDKAKNVSKSDSLTCQICEMTLSNAGNLRRHNLLHTGEKRFKCKNCNARFYQSHHLIQHNATHLNVKKFTCDICMLKFKTLRYLIRHKKNHNNNNSTFGKMKNEPHYKCSVCKKVFSYKGNLRRHILSHNTPAPKPSKQPTTAPFKCDLCDKVYKKMGHLQRHTLIHTDQGKNKCDMCKASFANLTLLHKHKKREHTKTYKPKNKRLTI